MMYAKAIHHMCCCLVALACVCRSAGAQDVGEVLTNVRRESGLARLALHPEGVQLTGEQDEFGEMASWSCTFTPAWRFVTERRGRFTTIEACDGGEVVASEIGGEVRIRDFGERFVAITELGLMTGMLLAEGNGMTWSIDEAGGTPDTVVLTATPNQGGTRVWVRIDRGDWRPRQWRLRAGEHAYRYDLSGAVEFDGIRFPKEVRAGNGVTRIDAAGAAAPNEDRFRLERATPQDTTFDETAPALLECKSTRDKRLLVRARIDGKDLGWFVFDTGGPHFFLERAAAKSAGLEGFGAVPLAGIGGEADAASFVKAGTITIGPMTVRDPVIVVGDLNLQALGEPVVGVIGFPLVARCVLEFDPEGTSLRVFKPGARTLPAGEWVNLRQQRGMPTCRGEIEGRRALFVIDTGGVSTVINEPTVRTWKLLEGRELAPEQVVGVGGVITLQRGRLKQLGFGDYAGRDVPVLFANDPKGDFVDTFTNGSVGVELLRSYVMVLDYPGGRMALVSREEWMAGENP